VFGGSMLEVSSAERSRRSYVTLASLGIQAMAMAFLIVVSIVKPVGLPLLRQLSLPVRLGPPPGPAPLVQHPRSTSVAQSNPANNVIVAPHEVPQHITMVDDNIGPPQLSVGDYGPVGNLGSSRMGVPDSIAGSMTRPILPSPPPAASRPPRISHMMEGNLIYRITPEYPTLARSARIQGAVLLSAIISKDGTIENLRVVSGHPMLVRAAIEAVSRWRYRPYVLNNEPVEVETQITVNFSLEGH
jgi:protein TonB